MCPNCQTSICSKTKGVTNPFKCEEILKSNIVVKKDLVKIL